MAFTSQFRTSSFFNNNMAYIIYTSGSAGKPKGVMIDHSSVLNRLIWMISYFQFDKNLKVLQKTSMSFDVSVWELFTPLLVGGSLQFLASDSSDLHSVIDNLIRYHITSVHFVPSVLNQLLPHLSANIFLKLKHLICSGENLDVSVVVWLQKKFGVSVFNLYGPTETTVDSLFFLCDNTSKIGKPIWNTSVLVLNSYRQVCPVGTPGELYIGGVGVARGYLNRPELTSEKFIENPFKTKKDEKLGRNLRLYRTGDLVRYSPDGNVEFIGRIDYQIKLRGFRIELGEIESQLRKHKKIGEAVVIAREDQSGDKRLIAYVT